jgi:hypothetical protein
VAKLYPQALGSLLVASYNSQGYGGGIRTLLYTGIRSFSMCVQILVEAPECHVVLQLKKCFRHMKRMLRGLETLLG